MISPPSHPLDSQERKAELRRTLGVEVQVLARAAENAGWSKTEFLEALKHAASVQLNSTQASRGLKADRICTGDRGLSA